jgi:hypothetical protein
MINLDIYNVLKMSHVFYCNGTYAVAWHSYAIDAGIAKRHDVLRIEGKQGKYVKVLESTFLPNKRQIN